VAIDTAAKRKSCIGLGTPWNRPGVIPDGSSLSASQRLHVQYLYSGIAAAVPVVAIPARYTLTDAPVAIYRLMDTEVAVYTLRDAVVTVYSLTDEPGG
jgi:hypothetical protein